MLVQQRDQKHKHKKRKVKIVTFFLGLCLFLSRWVACVSRETQAQAQAQGSYAFVAPVYT